MKRRFCKYFLHLFFIILCILSLWKPTGASAAESTEPKKQYGILIADKNNTFTWYDLNQKENGASIEITADGRVMVPAWKFASLIPEIKYSYNKTSKLMTLTNKSNGRKITCTVNSSSCTYYASATAKGAIKEMPHQMYISKESKAVMISADTLKWVMSGAGGYQYYKPAAMQANGFDTYSYSAVFAYNPFGKITALPKATKVKGLSATVKVTIPEGFSVAQTFDLLVKKGVCASADLLYDACQNYDYSYYPLIAELNENEFRCFRLEGYLFPDTYEFYRLSSGQDAIGRFLRNAESKITVEMRERAEELGFSVNEIITLASIIEKEINISSQMPKVASVLYNRLDQKMRLQVDACSFYVERYIKPYITGDKDRYNSYYNTYKCPALPAGPIASPGIKAINAALYPAESDALFFLSDGEGNYYYSATYEEHLKKLEEIKALDE